MVSCTKNTNHSSITSLPQGFFSSMRKPTERVKNDGSPTTPPLQDYCQNMRVDRKVKKKKGFF